MSQFSQELLKLESPTLFNICRMSDCVFILLFYSFFFLFLFYMFTLKICVIVFSGIIETRIFELGIHMDDELWYGVIEHQAHFSYSSLYLSIFLSFLHKICVTFSQELVKLDISYLVYRFTMSSIV